MTRPTVNHAGVARAFTIVEVLVTVAIIALLAGLLAPALSGVRATGRQTLCQANLRQMATAATQYANHHDHWPLAVRYEQRDGQLLEVAWDWVTTFDGQLVSTGPLWSFTDSPEHLQQCPEYHGPSNSPGDPYTGYNYNTTFIGGEGNFHPAGSTDFRRGVRPHACARASSCAMFGCGGWIGGANKFMRAPVTTGGHALATVYSGGQAFRHRGTTSVAWVDGHVGAADQPHEGERATDGLLREYLDHPRNGFLSDDDTAYDPR